MCCMTQAYCFNSNLIGGTVLLIPQHYVWAGGHIVLLLTSLRYLLAYVMFRAGALGWYYKSMLFTSCWATNLAHQQRVRLAAYTGALISYAIVCRYVACSMFLRIKPDWGNVYHLQKGILLGEEHVIATGKCTLIDVPHKPTQTQQGGNIINRALVDEVRIPSLFTSSSSNG